ncbi:MAG: hypothetical protein ABJG47_17245 [Ekhidna sp.]
MKTKEDVHIHVKLIDENKEPISGGEYVVRFFDEDVVVDDFLGESLIDDFGHAQVIVSEKDFKVGGSALEKYPDIYFKVYKGDEMIYKSKVFKSTHLTEAKDYPASNRLHYDLGIFKV